MKKANLFLLMVLFFILAYAFLLLPLLDQVKVPTMWGSAIDYGREHIVTYGHIYDPSTENPQTWQGALKKYGAEDVLSKIYFAMINVICGSSGFPEDLDLFPYIPIATMVLIPASVISCYYVFLKISGTKPDLLVVFLLLAISIFPMSMAISGGNTNGTYLSRGLFILLMLIFISTGSFSISKIMLYLLLLIPFYLYYHTWSYYYVITMAVVLAASLVFKNRMTAGMSLLSVILYGMTGLAVNYQQLLYTPLLIISMLGLNKEAPVAVKAYTPFITLNSYLNFVNVILIFGVICLFIYTYFYLRRVRSGDILKLQDNMLMVAFAIPLIAIALFLQGGLETVLGRLLEYSIYLFLIYLSFLLVVYQRKVGLALKVCVVLIVIISIFNFIYSQNTLRVELTEKEYAGIAFTGSRLDNAPIFSDFRLGTPLIYFDKTSIYTLDSQNQIPAGRFYELIGIYYNATGPHKALDRVMPHEDYYVVASEHQTEVALGDSSFSSLLRPADARFQDNFKNDRNFSHPYTNGDLCLYYHSSTG